MFKLEKYIRGLLGRLHGISLDNENSQVPLAAAEQITASFVFMPIRATGGRDCEVTAVADITFVVLFKCLWSNTE